MLVYIGIASNSRITFSHDIACSRNPLSFLFYRDALYKRARPVYYFIHAMNAHAAELASIMQLDFYEEKGQTKPNAEQVTAGLPVEVTCLLLLSALCIYTFIFKTWCCVGYVSLLFCNVYLQKESFYGTTDFTRPNQVQC